MTSHTLTTDLKFTYDGAGYLWNIYKNNHMFAQVIAKEEEIIKIVELLNLNL